MLSIVTYTTLILIMNIFITIYKTAVLRGGFYLVLKYTG